MRSATRILIINPPLQAIGPHIPGVMVPPLGLQAIGGPLIDDGHRVKLINGSVANLALEDIVLAAERHAPDVVLIGNNGSTSAHPTVVALLRVPRPFGLLHRCSI